MVTITKKAGRPKHIHRTANGTQIVGLMRLKDGRWRASGPEKFTFSEADEGRAVARFYEWQSRQQNTKLLIPAATARSGDAEGVRRAITAVVKPAKRKPFSAIEEWHEAFVPALYPTGGTTPLRLEVTDDGRLLFYDKPINADAFWPWLAQLLLKQGQLAAKMTGIEQLGYLGIVERPAPSPTLDEIGKLYAKKQGLSANEASRSRLFWKEFCEAVGVTTVRELTHDLVHVYENKILSSKYSPKSILHRVRKVRTILAHGVKRGKGVEDCRRALDCTAGIEVKKAQPLDPKPIEVATFWKMYRAATDAGDATFAAMMLAALNCAMYAGEVAALRWEEIDLKAAELVTRRPKTGVSRVAIIWPETVKALKALPRVGEFVFNTKVRSYTVFSVLEKWRVYREALKLPADVVFGQIRDASYSIACRSSNLDQARILAGHRLPGMADSYVRRRPDFVKDACLAIHEAFHVRTKAKV
jgi:integrase